MRFVTRSLQVLASLLIAVSAGAHEGGLHSRGIVKEIAPDRLVIASTAGGEVSVTLVPRTRVLRGKRVVPITDIEQGERAVVHAASKGGGLEATEVRLAERAKRPKE